MYNIEIRMDNLIEDIKSISEEQQQLKAILDAKIADLTCKYKEKETILINKKMYAEKELRALFEQVESKETKTQRKVSLLNGDVIVKKEVKKLDYDKAKLLNWASNNGRHDLIQQKISSEFKWSEYKAELIIDGDNIVNINTGEIVNIDGVAITTESEVLVIK